MVAVGEVGVLVGVGVVPAVGCAVGVDLGMVSFDSCYLPYWLMCGSLDDSFGACIANWGAALFLLMEFGETACKVCVHE